MADDLSVAGLFYSNTITTTTSITTTTTTTTTTAITNTTITTKTNKITSIFSSLQPTPSIKTSVRLAVTLENRYCPNLAYVKRDAGNPIIIT